MLKTINVTLLTLYCSLIFWLSSQAVLPTPMLFSHQDKLHHMTAYFIMGILVWRFFKDYLTRPNILAVVSLFYCSLYGATDEWHQSFVAGREADIFDWLADTTGALLALVSVYYLKLKR